MKKLIFILLATALLFTADSGYAQTATTKVVSAAEITPANVLKWTKEVLPKMEPLVPKLEKIKATTTGKSKMDGIKYLVAVTQLKEVNAKGTRLKAAEAKRYYDLIAATNGNVCCIDCINHGILGVWCLANCFVARFPVD